MSLDMPCSTGEHAILLSAVCFISVYKQVYSAHVSCKKYPCIHGYFVASFPYFNRTFQCGHVLHYSVNVRIQTYMEPILLKSGKLKAKYLWISGYFLQCACHVGAIPSRSVLSKCAICLPY